MKSPSDNWDTASNTSTWPRKGDNTLGKLSKLKSSSCRKVIIKNWRGQSHLIMLLNVALRSSHKHRCYWTTHKHYCPLWLGLFTVKCWGFQTTTKCENKQIGIERRHHVYVSSIRQKINRGPHRCRLFLFAIIT